MLSGYTGIHVYDGLIARHDNSIGLLKMLP